MIVLQQGGTGKGCVAKAIPDLVHYPEQAIIGNRVLKKVELGIAPDQVTKLHAHQPDQLSSFVEAVEQNAGAADQFLVTFSIRNNLLSRKRI